MLTIGDLFHGRLYLSLMVKRNELKWYEIFKKKGYKRLMDFHYSLMRAELIREKLIK